MKYLGFEWDDQNAGKVAGHDLAPRDVEDLFDQGQPVFMRLPGCRDRNIALGFTPDGRFVLVVFVYDKEARWVRVVTAYEAEHERWWQIYIQKAQSKNTR